jgi:succinylarginine dihydrolase
MASGNGPISELFVVDVRQSMANGGGPACLRLRVVADPDTVDPRFIADQQKLDWLSEVIEEHWPERIEPDDLANPELWEQLESARETLLDGLELSDLA